MRLRGWVVFVALMATVTLSGLVAGCGTGINPCPGMLTCASHKCCPTGYPYHCGDQCYTAPCTGYELCTSSDSSADMSMVDVVQGLINGDTAATAKTSWQATNACNNGVERYTFGADGSAHYSDNNFGPPEMITWSELNSTTMLFTGSAVAVQLRDIVGSLADGQFQAESLHTGGGNAHCGYILSTQIF